MDKAIYLISIKQVQDKWLPSLNVYSHSKLIKVISARLSPNYQIYSAPICECVQFAGLSSSIQVNKINLIEAFNSIYSPDFESGLPSSLQSCSLDSALIPNLTSPDQFHTIFSFLSSQDFNSILFVPQDFSAWFSAYSEIRLDNEDLTVHRIHFSPSMDMIIKSCIMRRKHWKMKIKVFPSSQDLNYKLVFSDTRETICEISKLESRLTLVLYPKTYKKSLSNSTKTMIYVKSMSERPLSDQRIHFEKDLQISSNLFYVPEYFVDAVLDNGVWFCRISHQGENQHPMVDLVSEKYFRTIDLSGIPANNTVLAKIREKKLSYSPSFCVKLQDRIISNLFTFLRDSIEIIN